MYNKFLFAIITVLFFSVSNAQEKVVKTFHIASPGGWDYIADNNGKLYVSHGTQVNILNDKTGDSIGVIPNTTGVHGIAFDNEVNKGFTSNGRLANVTVFDLGTNQIITQVVTGEGPDAIFFDSWSKKIITCNGRAKNLTVIDPVSYKVVATIELPGRPEEPNSDGEGKLYVNLEDKSEIAEIDMKTFTVLNHWSIAPGEGPTGLAMDRKTKRLFAGCDKLLMVIDATNGKIIDKLPIGDGCDGVAFDNENKMIYASCGEGVVTAIKEKSANEFKVKGNIITKRGARTITINEHTHTLYLPTADFEQPDPNAPKNTRPKMVAGSFQILVVQ
ncbi:MAG: YncE family protein [Chitinophagaceae bacterium]|nr:YncE family protein [Chitinophagaceae bacterium]